MKKILLIAALFLLSCETRVSSVAEATPSGHVNINGKDCSIVFVNAGEGALGLYFIDCGPGSSSVTYQSGKNHTTVGQYEAPPESTPTPANSAVDSGSDCPCHRKSK